MFRLIKKNARVGKVTIPYVPGKTPPPEGFLGAPEIDPSKCTGCGKCAPACPTDALVIEDKPVEDQRTLFLSYGDCIYCGLCEPTCPYQAISFKGTFELAEKNKEDLSSRFPFHLSQCAQDSAFIPQENLPVKGKPDPALELKKTGELLSAKVKKLFGRSLHIREVDAGSCNGCEIEITNLSNPIYDVERFGIHFVASPRHADMLLVTGPVTRQMELALVKTFEAAPAPKLVVACGGCAITGGIFKRSDAVVGGVDRVIPVDVYIPGCPPRPEAILHGIFVALDKLPRNTSMRQERHRGRPRRGHPSATKRPNFWQSFKKSNQTTPLLI